MFLSSSSLAQPGLSKAWLQLCPLLEEPHGGCGWHFLLRWWLSELLPRLKEATSKDTTTPLINGIRRTLLQPRLSLSSFHQAPFSRVHSFSNWIWVMMGGSLYQAAICQVQTHPSVLEMWGDEGFNLKIKKMGFLPWPVFMFSLVPIC